MIQHIINRKNRNSPDHCHHISGTQVKAHSNHHQSPKNQNAHSFCHQHPHDEAFSSKLMSWVYIFKNSKPHFEFFNWNPKKWRKIPNSWCMGNSKPLNFKKTTRKTSSFGQFWFFFYSIFILIAIYFFIIMYIFIICLFLRN